MALILPRSKDVTLTLRMLYLKTEKKLVAELKRQQAKDLVDYGTYASLMRVQKILQNMEDESFVYVPEMVNKIFRDANSRAAYEAAEALTVPQTAIAEQLTYNLLGNITEAAETALKTSETILQIGRLHPDVFRNPALMASLESEALGGSYSTAVKSAFKAYENEGITAFVDKSGRAWSLTDYCTMATRTVGKQAQTAAALTSDDWDLWQIVGGRATCSVCSAYQGRVYSKSGTNPDYPPLSMAFGKIDAAGGDNLANTYLNIHPNCLCSLIRYTTAGKTDKQIERDKEFSSFEKRPADVDYRSKKQLAAYREKERTRAEFLQTRRQWNDYRDRLGKEIPSLETFEKHKKAGDDKYKAWEKAYRKKGAELRKEIKTQEMIPNPAPPAVQYKPFESGESANAYFGERPPRSLRRENREEYDRLREEYSRSTYGTWEAGLTGDESLSIANYSGDAYSGINGLLRKQMTEKMVDAWDATERMGIKDMIGNIDSALEKFELKDPIRVFRTCERDVLDALRPEVGATFRDNGYVSTSALSKKVASGNVVMQIDVPPGRNHGAWINPLSGAADEEYEYLLPRGSEFRITGVEQKGGDTVIKMEFIGSKKQPIDYATKEEVIDRWKRLGIYDENNASKI